METDLLSRALESLDDVFFILSPDSEILESNGRLEAITGHDRETLETKEIPELFVPEDQTKVAETLSAVIETHEEQLVQATLETDTGDERAYELSFSPLVDETEFHGIVVVGRDISDQLMAERRLQELQAQVRSKSMPVVEVWDGVVLTTVVGALDTRQAEHLTEDLLAKIVEVEADAAIIDITGVDALDTATAQHLIDTINAVDLLGARVVITGISPAIAQTLVQLGIPLSDIETQSSLMDGLRLVLENRGVNVS